MAKIVVARVNKRNNLEPYLTRFEPLGEMVILGTYLRVGRGSEPIWLRGPKTSPKVPVIYHMGPPLVALTQN